MAIASLMSNVGKVWAWRREVDWRAFGAFSAMAIPAAALGARTLLILPADLVELALGFFFLIMIPAFAAFGLLKGALLSTEAMSSLFITMTKVATFRTLGALPLDLILKGLVVGSAVMAGTFVGKAVVQRMSSHAFQIVLDAMLLVSGLSLIWAATR
jgi:uncharacterized membrane protein YfcA